MELPKYNNPPIPDNRIGRITPPETRVEPDLAPQSFAREALSFLIHLRLHYQFFILSGAFLAGAVFAGGMSPSFVAQFLAVHVLLFGGATAYNSYWDRDEGPIGGLRHPPRLAKWTLPASWLLQAAGLAVSFAASPASPWIYAGSMLFFWLYSGPRFRWKGRPLLSLAAIGLSTGVGGFLLGWLHGGPRPVDPAPLLASLGTAAVILSLFPLSQIYQVGEDAARKDLTFAARYGVAGVRTAFKAFFAVGILLLAAAFAAMQAWLGGLFLLVGSGAGLAIGSAVVRLEAAPEAYGKVMAIKYAASGLFVAFLGVMLALQAYGIL
jgi:hypothetical protein